jgi:hypothetical protein
MNLSFFYIYLNLLIHSVFRNFLLLCDLADFIYRVLINLFASRSYKLTPPNLSDNYSEITINSGFNNINTNIPGPKKPLHLGIIINGETEFYIFQVLEDLSNLILYAIVERIHYISIYDKHGKAVQLRKELESIIYHKLDNLNINFVKLFFFPNSFSEPPLSKIESKNGNTRKESFFCYGDDRIYPMPFRVCKELVGEKIFFYNIALLDLKFCKEDLVGAIQKLCLKKTCLDEINRSSIEKLLWSNNILFICNLKFNFISHNVLK